MTTPSTGDARAWQCQLCGANIGLLGRVFRSVAGCSMYRGCRGTDFQRHLNSLPTTRWWYGAMALFVVYFVVLTILVQ